jgi:hypothetical protein
VNATELYWRVEVMKQNRSTLMGTALERRVSTLSEQAADLEARDHEITRQIAEAHATGDGDLEALTSERREVRAMRDDLTAALPILRERLAQHRVTAAEAAIELAQTAHGEEVRELDRVKRLEAELAEARQAAELSRLRGKLLSNCSRALVGAFNLDLPLIAVPNGPPPLGTDSRRTPLERALSLDELAEAVREVGRIVGQDPDLAVPQFEEAVDVLLEARPPKSPRQIMDERRTRVDAPHKAEIARVDAWVREQLSAGPVADTELRERAVAANIAIRGRSKLGWGQATLPDALRRVGAFAVVPYRGLDREELAAAEPYEEHGGRDGLWWVLHGTPGLVVPREGVTSALMMHALRG